MLIKCKQLRPDGSIIDLGKGADARQYHFKPLKGGDPDDHVCDIVDSDDIATLLAVKECFEIHASELGKKASKPAAPAAPTATKPAAPSASESPQKPATTATRDYEGMDKAALAKEVEARTGKKPHHSTGAAKLLATLQALDKAEAAK